MVASYPANGGRMSKFLCLLLLSSFGTGKTETAYNHNEAGSGQLEGSNDLSPNPLSSYAHEMNYENCCEVLNSEDLGKCSELQLLKCECGSVITLNASDFQDVNESTVLFNGGYFGVLLNSSQGHLVVCANVSQNVASSTQPLATLIYIGNTLTIIGYSLGLLTFFLFEELRTCPAKILAIIAATVIVTAILIMIGVSDAAGDSEFCKALAIFTHFFILSYFMWMTILLFEVCYSFYCASRLIPVRVKNTRCKYIMYSTASTIPLMIVILSIIISYTAPTMILYGRNPEGICWLIDFTSTMVALNLPAIILFVFQLIFFAISSFLLATSSKGGDDVKRTPYIRILLTVFFSSHISWLVGFITFAFRSYWSSYPVLILSSIQGFVVFFGFYGTKKVWRLYTSLLSNIVSHLRNIFFT